MMMYSEVPKFNCINLIVFIGTEDEQFEEEKEMIMKEIERVSRFINRER